MHNTQYTQLPASAFANVVAFGCLSCNQTTSSYEPRQLGILPTLALILKKHKTHYLTIL